MCNVRAQHLDLNVVVDPHDHGLRTRVGVDDHADDAPCGDDAVVFLQAIQLILQFLALLALGQDQQKIKHDADDDQRQKRTVENPCEAPWFCDLATIATPSGGNVGSSVILRQDEQTQQMMGKIH